MNVKELIEELSKFPPETKVFHINYADSLCEVRNVKEIGIIHDDYSDFESEYTITGVLDNPEFVVAWIR